MKLIILGPPGSGKGTQSKIISNKFDLIHISVGDIFRKLKNNKNKEKIKNLIDKGKLLPDVLINNIVLNYLELIKNKKGYILDGFPRTIVQAQSFDKFLLLKKEYLNLVIFLNLSDKIILNRILNRYYCLNCGSSYNKISNPSIKNNKCNHCGNVLIKRKDDTNKIILKRIKIYYQNIKKIILYYKKQNIICEINGDLTIEKTTQKILKFLKEKI